MDKDTALRQVMAHVDKSKNTSLIVVDRHGHAVGTITEGDIRRWLIGGPNRSVEDPCEFAANQNFVAAPFGTDVQQISRLASDEIRLVPLVDSMGILRAIARIHQEFKIGDREISISDPVYIVAEIGVNHDGDYTKGQKLVEGAKAAGADGVKFQMRQMDNLYRKSVNDSEDLGAEYTLDLLERTKLSNKDIFSLMAHATSLGLQAFCTPWDQASAKLLLDFGVPAIKIASADLTNHPLLRTVSESGVPMIISTGMSTEAEIRETVSLLQTGQSPYALLHCNSAYPAPFKDINLRYIQRLRQIGDCEVGLSGHDRGWHVALASVALGATILEKHLTLDKRSRGVDHSVSLEIHEFSNFVSQVREIEQALGTDSPRELSQGEKLNRLSLAKSIVAKTAITAGTKASHENLEIRSPGRGLQPNRLPEILGRPIHRDIPAGEFRYEEDLDEGINRYRDFEVPRPWGLPVRFHDWKDLADKSNPDFLEFHLSYRDLDADIASVLPGKLPYGLVVHSPDLFAGDLILDLASLDKEHRELSVMALQKVVDLSRNMSSHFLSEKPIVVASLGGATRDKPIQDRMLIEKKYELVIDSLEKLDLDGVELTAQTLPPFPWYLGGQWFCNLFVDPYETARFSEKSKTAICLDTSHTKLACTHLGIPFQAAMLELIPRTKHLHLVDAKGIDGEGLQIGEGEIDWAALIKALENLEVGVGFIPEIWQGHIGSGLGFWCAMDRLEVFFANGSAKTSK